MVLLVYGRVEEAITTPCGPSLDIKGKVAIPSNPDSVPLNVPIHTLKYLLVSHASKPPVADDLILIWLGEVAIFLSIPVVRMPEGVRRANTNFMGTFPSLATISGGITFK